MPENVTLTHNYRGERLFEPLQITIAVVDKMCPNCGARINDDLGLDLGYDNGECYGGLCFTCGWSFGFVGSGLLWRTRVKD